MYILSHFHSDGCMLSRQKRSICVFKKISKNTFFYTLDCDFTFFFSFLIQYGKQGNCKRDFCEKCVKYEREPCFLKAAVQGCS